MGAYRMNIMRTAELFTRYIYIYMCTCELLSCHCAELFAATDRCCCGTSVNYSLTIGLCSRYKSIAIIFPLSLSVCAC